MISQSTTQIRRGCCTNKCSSPLLFLVEIFYITHLKIHLFSRFDYKSQPAMLDAKSSPSCVQAVRSASVGPFSTMRPSLKSCAPSRACCPCLTSKRLPLLPSCILLSKNRMSPVIWCHAAHITSMRALFSACLQGFSVVPLPFLSCNLASPSRSGLLLPYLWSHLLLNLPPGLQPALLRGLPRG